MNFLLDTCVISDFFKKIPSVIDNFKKLSPNQIHISAITAMEIEYGLNLNFERSKKITPVWRQLLQCTNVVPFSTHSAFTSALIRSDLKTQGLPIGPYDILIAGTALANNMIMVTSNLKEFNRVAGLMVENWR